MNYKERDKAYNWHALTQHQHNTEPIIWLKGKGAYLFDDMGRKYFDAISSWYTCTYGHCHPQIIDKVKIQLDELDHVIFSGGSHKTAIELSEKLIEVLPENQSKLFYSDNGSTAVEVAIKMAIQFHANQGKQKHVVMALENGFHGDTVGAMSVSSLSVYNGSFEKLFIEVVRIPVPSDQNIRETLAKVEDILRTNNVAAFIYEPLVQGAAGMHMYETKYLESLLKLTSRHGVINIADEVMTGFGKTGKYFASDNLDHLPDLICMAKSLTGGVGPLAVTACTQKIFDGFLGESLDKGFMHAHTYTANPTMCAAALACLELLETKEIQDNIQLIQTNHEAFANKIKNHPKVAEVRCKGIIFALELKLDMQRYGKERNKLFNYFLKQGIYLRPLGNVIYLVPPFITTPDELHGLYESIEQLLVNIETIL